MSTNISNTVAYLRTSRSFTEEPKALCRDISKAYIDIANAINVRTIGIFSTNKASITGESWYLTSSKQQSLRQIYTFTAAGNVPHNLNFDEIDQFTKPSGSFTDGTKYYGAIYASDVAIAGQVSFYLTPTDIVILVGVGSPVIVKGIIILEWLSDV